MLPGAEVSCWAAGFWGVSLLGCCQCCWPRSRTQSPGRLLLFLPGLEEHTWMFRREHQHKCTNIISKKKKRSGFCDMISLERLSDMNWTQELLCIYSVVLRADSRVEVLSTKSHDPRSRITTLLPGSAPSCTPPRLKNVKDLLLWTRLCKEPPAAWVKCKPQKGLEHWDGWVMSEIG